jgi:hypothetical protein
MIEIYQRKEDNGKRNHEEDIGISRSECGHEKEQIGLTC